MSYYAQLLREEVCGYEPNGHDLTLCLWELTPEEGESVDEDRFYVTYWSNYHAQVQTAAPKDYPASGTWVSRGRQAGAIRYVANGRKRATATRIYRAIMQDARKWNPTI